MASFILRPYIRPLFISFSLSPVPLAGCPFHRPLFPFPLFTCFSSFLLPSSLSLFFFSSRDGKSVAPGLLWINEIVRREHGRMKEGTGNFVRLFRYRRNSWQMVVTRGRSSRSVSLIDDSARQMENKMRLPQWGKSVKGYESEKGGGGGKSVSSRGLIYTSTYIQCSQPIYETRQVSLACSLESR